MKNFFLLSTCLVLFLASCSPDPNPGPNGKKITFNLANKNITNADAFLSDKLKWSAGDGVGIFSPNITTVANLNFIVNNNNNIVTNIEFKDEQNHTFYIYHPFSGEMTPSNTDPTVNGVLQSEQISSSSVKDNMFLSSKVTALKSAGNSIDAQFSHAFAYLSFNISGSGYTNYRVKAVKFTAPTQYTLAGNYTATLSNATPIVFDQTGKSNSVTVTAGEQDVKMMTAAQNMLMVINPQDLSGKSIEILLDLEHTTNKSVTRFATTVQGKTFAAQTMTAYTLAVGSMTQRTDVAEVYKTSFFPWNGKATVLFSYAKVETNGISADPTSYGLRYRKVGTTQWTSVTADNNKMAAMTSLDAGGNYEYELWMNHGGNTVYSGEIANFTASEDPRNFYRTSLGLKFTATWCQYCPRMAESLKLANQSYNNRIQPVEMHMSTSTVAVVGNYATTVASNYNVTGLPTCIVDLRASAPNNDPSITSVALANIAKESKQYYTSVCGVEFSSKLNGSTVTVDATFLPKRTGAYKVTVVLLEDGFYTTQTGYSGSYLNNDVARVWMTAAMGDEMNMTAGTIATKQFSCTIPTVVNKDKCKVLIYIHRGYSVEFPKKQTASGATYSANYGEYYIDNCFVAKVGTSSTLKYEN